MEKIFGSIFIWLGLILLSIVAGVGQALWSAANGGPFLSPGETIGIRAAVTVYIVGLLPITGGIIFFGARLLFWGR